MTKHLVELNGEKLSAARAELGTTTIKDTVNQALELASRRRSDRVTAALDILGRARFEDRSEAWR